MSDPRDAGAGGGSPGGTVADPRAEAEAKRQAELEESSEATAFLTRLRRGRFMLQVARALRSVTKEVHAQRLKGSVVITLSITPLKKSPGAVTITDKIVAKPPVTAPPETTMFLTEDGSLTYEHPDQLSIAGVSGTEGR